MTVHFFNNETEELVSVKAAIYIPAGHGLPHKVLKSLDDDEFTKYDADKYTLSYIGR